MSPEQLAPIRVQFFQECVDLLAELEGGLNALKQGVANPETINTVFRAAHSIKGGAGIFGFSDLVRFAHDFESALADLRSGQISAGPAAVKILLHAADVLSDLVDAARDGRAPDTQRLEAATVALNALGGSAGSAPREGDVTAATEPGAVDLLDDLDFAPVPVDLDGANAEADAPSEPLQARTWQVRLRPFAELYRNANDPVVLLNELARLGPLSVELDAGATPPLQDLDPEASHLAWNVLLTTESDAAEIREIFEFVEGDCDLDIRLAEAAPPIAAARPAVAIAPSAMAEAPEAAVSRPATAATPTIRVDLDRVDRLIDLVSELVISEATLAERLAEVAALGNTPLAAALEDLRHLTRDLQESVMAIRAQPVKSLFQRMSRLVREVEALTGKSINLTTEGEETEVDRAVIERLTDPLTHMIRNAVDHGIETPEGRRAANKPLQGSVHIRAAHRAGRVVIDVDDDGAGINRERVRAKAIDRGLVLATDVLSDEEIENLIFEPGFSTTEHASDLSGRGVGMDVVRKSVQALGGRISVSSRPGQGASFSLSLPLTLAVMDGMLVTVRGQCLVVPLTALVESVMPKPGDIRRLGPNVDVMAIRGAYVPLVDLGEALAYSGGAQRPTREAGQGVALLVEDDAGERIALWVDDIVDQRQVVIKSLEANYQPLSGIAAATILGDGRVALIVDVNALVGARRSRPVPDAERQVAHA